MNKANYLLTGLAAVSIAACGWTAIEQAEGSDKVAIGDQAWMAKNLDVATFSNGEPIYHARTEDEWKSATMEQKPAWCYMNHDSAMAKNHGKLYNWYAVSDPRGLAPTGWHIPSDEEWTQLTGFLGKNAGHKMKSTEKQIRSGNGSNKSGFSGNFGGHCFANGMFTNRHVSGVWWSATERDEDTAWTLQLSRNNKEATRAGLYKTFGASVRCVMD